MRVAMLIAELRTWGAAGLMIFPARRRCRTLEVELDALRGHCQRIDSELATTASACEMLAQSAGRARTTL